MGFLVVWLLLLVFSLPRFILFNKHYAKHIYHLILFEGLNGGKKNFKLCHALISFARIFYVYVRATSFNVIFRQFLMQPLPWFPIQLSRKIELIRKIANVNYRRLRSNLSHSSRTSSASSQRQNALRSPLVCTCDFHVIFSARKKK